MLNLKQHTPNILVVGDLMIDRYLYGSAEKISPEAPVPVVNIESENSVLGGAGNVANNLHCLGAKVDILSVIGTDDIADELLKLLADIGISGQYLITEKKRITAKKSRLIASNQQVIRYDKESKSDIDAQSEQRLIDIFSNIANKYNVILLSDYGKGVLTNNLTQALIKIANQNQQKVLIDPKGIDYHKYRGAYLLTPNKKEASQATNINITDKQSLTQAITKLKIDCQLSVSLITLSEQGVAIYTDKLTIFPTVAQEVFDVTGAGDTVLASLGFALACDYDINKAVIFANLAAGVVVAKIGSATANLDEIATYKNSLAQNNTKNRIKTQDEISSLVNSLKKQGKKIVFTNGCFDILHIGHVEYLSQAKACGDVLILGLNSDKSVQHLKGNNRPINTQKDRAYILAALESVDYVVIFNENTPYELIKVIQPNVLVKGGDYKNKEVVGQDIADKLTLINFIDGKSTTQTIEKIKNL